MRIEMTDGEPVVPADELGPMLGVAPADLPQLMRDGVVTARHEQGFDEDAGRFRLSFRYRDRLVRLTCTDDGTVVSKIKLSGVEPGADAT